MELIGFKYRGDSFFTNSLYIAVHEIPFFAIYSNLNSGIEHLASPIIGFWDKSNVLRGVIVRVPCINVYLLAGHMH